MELDAVESGRSRSRLSRVAHRMDTFDKAYDYLQLTRGRNLCKGYTIMFSVTTKQGPEEFYADYYLGPMGPAIVCERREEKTVTLTGSDCWHPFRNCFEDGSGTIFLNEKRF